VRLTDRAIARMYEVKSSPLPYLPLELLAVEWSAGTHTTTNTVVSTPAPTTQPIQPKPASPIISKPTPPPQPITTTTKPVESVEPTIAVEEQNTSPAPENADMAQVKKAWNALISEIEKTTPSLIFILKNAILISATAGVLKLNVAYSFHQDKIIQVATRKRIEDHLATLLGYRLTLEVGIDENMQQKNVAADLNDLATALGGSVI
jgi:hypothetical protein